MISSREIGSLQEWSVQIQHYTICTVDSRLDSGESSTLFKLDHTAKMQNVFFQNFQPSRLFNMTLQHRTSTTFKISRQQVKSILCFFPMAATRYFDRSCVFIIRLAAFYENVILLSDNFGGYDISLFTSAISDREEGLDVSTDN